MKRLLITFIALYSIISIADEVCDPVLNIDSMGVAWNDFGELFTGSLSCTDDRLRYSVTYQLFNGQRHGPSIELREGRHATTQITKYWSEGVIIKTCYLNIPRETLKEGPKNEYEEVCD